MRNKLIMALIPIAISIPTILYFYPAEKKEIPLSKNASMEELPDGEDQSNNKPENLAEPEPGQPEIKNPIGDKAENTVETEKPKEEEREKAPVFKISGKLVNWGFQKADNRAIDAIIIHSSYNAVGDDPYNLDDIIYKEYKPYGVSPHYIISREGGVYRLVEDKNIAYHAGESKTPDGRTNVNNFSIGIEIVNKQSESPSKTQYESLKNLLNFLKSKYEIKYILGHSDIAPGRKTDPWNFDWSKIK